MIRRRALTLFSRALRLRCPHCGGGPIFVRWSRLVPNCPVCGLGLERGEEGYWLGAYFFNLMAVETVFSVWFVGHLEGWTSLGSSKLKTEHFSCKIRYSEVERGELVLR